MRFKPNHINNYIKYKYSKHTYEKSEIVQLYKNVRPNYILTIRSRLGIQRYKQIESKTTEKDVSCKYESKNQKQFYYIRQGVLPKIKSSIS